MTRALVVYESMYGNTRAIATAIADGPGLREWFAAMGQFAGASAAFDTRMQAPAGMSGSVARKIAKQLRAHGFDSTAKPERFYVTKANQLVDGELARALSWGQQLSAKIPAR